MRSLFYILYLAAFLLKGAAASIDSESNNQLNFTIKYKSYLNRLENKEIPDSFHEPLIKDLINKVTEDQHDMVLTCLIEMCTKEKNRT